MYELNFEWAREHEMCLLCAVLLLFLLDVLFVNCAICCRYYKMRYNVAALVKRFSFFKKKETISFAIHFSISFRVNFLNMQLSTTTFSDDIIRNNSHSLFFISEKFNDTFRCIQANGQFISSCIFTMEVKFGPNPKKNLS